MVENGFPRVSCYGHRGEQVDNGRKWPKMVEKWSKKVHRGYLVENGFSRFLRHSPTTSDVVTSSTYNSSLLFKGILLKFSPHSYLKTRMT